MFTLLYIINCIVAAGALITWITYAVFINSLLGSIISFLILVSSVFTLNILEVYSEEVQEKRYRSESEDMCVDGKRVKKFVDHK